MAPKFEAMNSVRIAFLGLGGVGGYFGAKLARTYSGSDNVEIIFLARAKTADEILKNGLRLITPSEDFTAHPHSITTHGKDIGPVDFLVCSVKSYDLEASLKQFIPCIGPQTIIIPLLNGIDAVTRTKNLFPNNEVWSGCVYIVSRIAEPAVIRESGNIHTLHFGHKEGDPDKLQLLRDILRKAHSEIFLQENIDEVVWEKFVFISTIASLTSYLDVCIGKILEHAGNRKLLSAMLEEITAVARAEKIPLPGDIITAAISKMEQLPYETTSSMHSDFQRGNTTEVQSLTAQVVQLASNHGIAVPVYQRILQGLMLRQSDN